MSSEETTVVEEQTPMPVSDPHLQPAVYAPRRTEMFIAGAFIVAILCLVALAITYWVGGQTQAEGAFLGAGLGALGFGLTAWGKYLMPRGPFVEDRHELSGSEEDRESFAGALRRGQVAIERRSFLGVLLAGGLGIFSIIAAFPLIRSLGPRPGNTLYHTTWRPGTRLVGIDGRPVHVDTLQVGGVLTVFPEHDVGSAVSQTVLLRAASAPIVTKPGRETWSPAGYLAFSKVCTHAGCPVGLYEEQFQQLLCPCHQSLFNILEGAQPVFGPAPRPLPQLPLALDAKGFLLAQHDYDEPIGPGFWERGA